MADPKTPIDATLPSPRRTSTAATVDLATTSLLQPPTHKLDPSGKRLATAGRRKGRYRGGEVIGRGGMGEVHVARDRRIGRSVAIKVLLDEAATRSDAQRRFLREARVQGQLEHPAIVPVYDLGWDREGRPYFAMKRVSGVTLGDVIHELRRRNPEVETKYSVRRLLSVFQQVCLAIEYAHARGVVHRDVKPSNLMLGDFGEVYVLDWGIAKVLESTEPESATLRLSGSRVRAPAGATGADKLLGTLGYMAPEQITGASSVDARADVYSLGTVLFQLLSLEPLHGYGNVAERARSTQEGADARASRRAPDRGIPPELDAICAKATALHPDDRYPSARALHDAIEAFLEGDRDMRLRGELADQHVSAAQAAVASVLVGATDSDAQRKIALREAGRALALDPKHEVAAGIIARLVLEPPKHLPPEVREATEAAADSELRRAVRLASFALLVVTPTAVLLPLTGAVRSWLGVGAVVGAIVLTAVYGLAASRAGGRRLRDHTVLVSIPLCVALAGLSGVLGPLLLAPTLALGFSALVSVAQGLGRRRFAMVALTCAAWAVPAILEWTGRLPPAYAFDGGVMTIFPRLTHFSEQAMRLWLFGLNLATTLVVCALLHRSSAWVAESRARQQLHAWHLEHIAPSNVHQSEARPPAPPQPPFSTRC